MGVTVTPIQDMGLMEDTMILITEDIQEVMGLTIMTPQATLASKAMSVMTPTTALVIPDQATITIEDTPTRLMMPMVTTIVAFPMRDGTITDSFFQTFF